MNRVDRKNNKRRLEAASVRQNRVIVGYVQHVHPGVYDEAEKFYQILNAKHPEKKDLRKTNDYEWVKCGLPGFQQKRRYTRKSRNQKNNGEQAETRNVGDNMRLEIPLISIGEKSKEVVDMSRDTEIELEVVEQPVVMEELGYIPDETFEGMIRELREDPDLNDIFNDFEIFDYDDETPLERELDNVFVNM